MSLIPGFIYQKIGHSSNLLMILENTIWLFLDKILRLGLGFTIGVWFARYLGPEQFGIFNYVIAFSTLFLPLASLGIQGVLVRELNQNAQFKGELLGSSVMLLFLSGIITFLLLTLANFYFNQSDKSSKNLVEIAGLALLFKFSEISSYWFESQVESKWVVIVQNFVFVIFSIVKIILMIYQSKLTTFVWVFALESICTSLLLILIFYFKNLKLIHLKISSLQIFLLLKESWPYLLSGLSVMVYTRIDQIMLAKIVSNESIGYYSVALRFSEIWYILPTIICTSVFPKLYDLKINDHKKYLLITQKILALMVLISTPLAIVISIIANPLIILIYGKNYSEAGNILIIHIWTAIFVFLATASGQWNLSEKLGVIVLRRYILGAILNISLNLFLIPILGAVGTAIATLITQITVGLIFDYFHPSTRPIFYMKINAFNPFYLKNLFVA